ncbi:MAG: peptidoglycan-binding domain-containing protein, partial [Atribacterota bacterium]|nr:peptidoglycan-binding domain-containing protein [Atribacterota bacterium]
MKKIIILLFLLLTPTLASATLDQNLYYGLFRNDGVKELQRYLIEKGFMTGQATGNFYTVTLSAVKNYQASKNIITTGYVGPLTRQSINADLSSTQTPTQIPATPTNPVPLTGSLNLLQNTAYSSQAATIPQTKFKLADFSLTNNTTESINLNKIQIDLAIDSSLYISNLYIRNLYIIYGSNKTTILDTVAHNNYWSINYQLPIGRTINLSVYGDVNSSIPLNSVVNCGALVTGVTTVTAATVNSNSNVVSAGQGITFGSGSLVAAQDSTTPPAKIATINQRIVAGKFKFTSTGDLYTISELKFMIPNSRAISAISAAVLTDSTDQTLSITKPALVAYSDNKYVVDFNVSIPISSNSTKTLTLYYDLGPNIYYSTVANASIAPILAYVKARNSRETLMDGVANDYTNSIAASYDNITLPNDGVKVNDVYVFKSAPTFTVSSSSTTALSNSEINLYTFNVGADKNGDISMKQIMFAVTINDPSAITFPHLNNFKLFKGDKDYTNSVIIGNNVNNNYVGLTG